jgi:hypothetical protein
VEEFELILSPNKEAALPPAGNSWDELIRAGDFYVDVELVLEKRKGFKKPRGFRVGLEINIDGHAAPSVQNCGNAASEVNPPFTVHALPKGDHESLDAALIGSERILRKIKITER